MYRLYYSTFNAQKKNTNTSRELHSNLWIVSIRARKILLPDQELLKLLDETTIEGSTFDSRSKLDSSKAKYILNCGGKYLLFNVACLLAVSRRCREASYCLDVLVAELKVHHGGTDGWLLIKACLLQLELLLSAEISFGRAIGGCSSMNSKMGNRRGYSPDELWQVVASLEGAASAFVATNSESKRSSSSTTVNDVTLLSSILSTRVALLKCRVWLRVSGPIAQQPTVHPRDEHQRCLSSAKQLARSVLWMIAQDPSKLTVHTPSRAAADTAKHVQQVHALNQLVYHNLGPGSQQVTPPAQAGVEASQLLDMITFTEVKRVNTSIVNSHIFKAVIKTILLSWSLCL